jgi:hypothetical protein
MAADRTTPRAASDCLPPARFPRNAGRVFFEGERGRWVQKPTVRNSAGAALSFKPSAPTYAADAQLHAAGCAKIYAEKISGARSDRPELAKVLRRLEPDSKRACCDGLPQAFLCQRLREHDVKGD